MVVQKPAYDGLSEDEKKAIDADALKRIPQDEGSPYNADTHDLFKEALAKELANRKFNAGREAL